jgi:hypothetical protein
MPCPCLSCPTTRLAALLTTVLLFTGCAGPKYTVDDGSKVNEELLGHIRSYGAGENTLRPAIARSAALKDPDCDTQWELPFAVATSHGWDKADRIAWVRGLGVDERLTVVGITPDSPLKLRDKIQRIGNYKNDEAEKMLAELAKQRDWGQAFSITLATGATVSITPFKVCRGYTRLTPPNAPTGQDYHWLMALHPLQVAKANLTEDEALWMVLWSQGVSEEGGLRMKAYHYGTKIAGAMYNIFTIATGIKGAALAADAAIKAAQTIAANAANDLIKKQIIDQATSFAVARMRDELTSAAQKLTQQQVVGAMQQAAINRTSLSGVARVAATVFDRADTWAYTRLQKLGANPLTGFALHQKLIEQGATANAMVFDPERMTSLSKLAESQGRADDVVALLQGLRPEDLQFALSDMPLASAPDTFSYDNPNDPAYTSQPFARGLIDGMLDMPMASTTTPDASL